MLSLKYGGVSFKTHDFDFRAMVVLNDYKSVKEALVTQGASTSDRPQGNKKALINPHRLGKCINPFTLTGSFRKIFCY